MTPNIDFYRVVSSKDENCNNMYIWRTHKKKASFSVSSCFQDLIRLFTCFNMFGKKFKVFICAWLFASPPLIEHVDTISDQVYNLKNKSKFKMSCGGKIIGELREPRFNYSFCLISERRTMDTEKLRWNHMYFLDLFDERLWSRTHTLKINWSSHWGRCPPSERKVISGYLNKFKMLSNIMRW